MADLNSPRELTVVRTDAEATAIKTALAGCGIQASSTGTYTAGFQAEAPGTIKIWVREQDLEQAKTALQEIDGDSEDIDWSSVDVGDPID